MTQQQQQVTLLLCTAVCTSGTRLQQQINQLVHQQQADKQQQAAEILLLKREVDRLRDDVGKRSSHQDQAALPACEWANTCGPRCQAAAKANPADCGGAPDSHASAEGPPGQPRRGRSCSWE